MFFVGITRGLLRRLENRRVPSIEEQNNDRTYALTLFLSAEKLFQNETLVKVLSP
jgi:hypothetical protein